MTSRAICGLILGLLLFGPPEADAQFEECTQEDDTLEECLKREYREANRVIKVKEQSAEAEGQKAAEAKTATDVISRLGAAGATSDGALLDLLTSFLGAVGTNTSGTDLGDIELKKVFSFGEASEWRLAVGTKLLVEPDLFSPLEMMLMESLPEDGRDEKIEEIEGRIESYEDLEAMVDLSFEGSAFGLEWGRRPQKYGLLSASAFSSSFSLDESYKEAYIGFLNFDEAFVKKYGEACRGSLRDAEGQSITLDEVTSLKINRLRGLLVAGNDCGKLAAKEARDLFDKAVRKEKEFQLQVSSDLDAKLKKIAGLVSNQPQLIVNGTYKDRGELTGPDALDFSFKFEFGLGGNVNGLNRWAGNSSKTPEGCESLQEVGDETTWSMNCIEEYLSKRAKKPENGNRLSLMVTYSDVDEFSFSLPEDNFEFSADAAEKWTGMLSYSRWVTGLGLLGGAGSDQKSRLDIDAMWEDVNDDMRQSRFVATASISQRIAKCTAFSVGLVWANKPEFRGAVDEELSARLGIRWDRKAVEGCDGS